MKTSIFTGLILSILILLSCTKSIDLPDDLDKDKDTIVIEPAKGSYKRLPEPIDCGKLLPARRIWVYLPPNYEKDITKKYPVCYMHDGQNIFENGGYGSWSMQNMLNARALEGKKVGIVVAIDNSSKRLSEYTPFPNPSNAPVASGDEYLQAIVKHIMPYVNSNYRTLTDRKNTMLCGSSLGGLISYFAAFKADSVFGRIGAVSPAFWYCKNDLKTYTNKVVSRYPNDTKIYFICGDSESQSTVPDMQEFYNYSLAKGIPKESMKYEVLTGGKHNEASWSNQIGRVYDFLFE